jgi:hypothetical protein
MRRRLSTMFNIFIQFAAYGTYDHRTLKIRLPVRSAIYKQCTGGLVVRWVTTSESPLLYVFVLFFFCPFCDYAPMPNFEKLIPRPVRVHVGGSEKGNDEANCLLAPRPRPKTPSMASAHPKSARVDAKSRHHQRNSSKTKDAQGSI